LHVSLHDLPGVDAYRDAVASYARDNPREPWIFGGGWLMAHFPGGTPTKELLDDVVPDRPVFLLNRDVHGAWVNSKALEDAHITRETPDPWDGRIERDPATGEPTGTLHEGAAYSFADAHLPPPPREEWERAILLAQEHLHSLGITGWQDAWVTPSTEESYRSLAERGDLTARVVGALWWDRHRGPEQIEELVARRDRGVAGNFHPTAVKIMTDGVLENHTGAMLRPYCDATGHETDETGISYLDHDQLVEAVTALDREGFQVHMHAIGDRAVRNGLDACEAARDANGARDSRHHLAHLQVVHPDDVPRFRDLAVIANCQPYWAQHDPQMDELTVPFLGPERAPLQYPFASLHAAGATLAFGSDWSVSTADPLEEMEVAIRRADPSTRDADPFLGDQRIPLHLALAAFTKGASHVNLDDDAGSIEEGNRADLVVLDRNLFDQPDATVADARVEHTLAAGRVVFSRT
jgi:predicted amidohydrolase YtcJ